LIYFKLVAIKFQPCGMTKGENVL